MSTIENVARMNGSAAPACRDLDIHDEADTSELCAGDVVSNPSGFFEFLLVAVVFIAGAAMGYSICAVGHLYN